MTDKDYTKNAYINTMESYLKKPIHSMVQYKQNLDYIQLFLELLRKLEPVQVVCNCKRNNPNYFHYIVTMNDNPFNMVSFIRSNKNIQYECFTIFPCICCSFYDAFHQAHYVFHQYAFRSYFTYTDEKLDLLLWLFKTIWHEFYTNVSANLVAWEQRKCFVQKTSRRTL